MASSSDRHAETADALKALAEGASRKPPAADDAFVGPEPPEEAPEAGAADAALPSEAVVRSALRPEAPPTASDSPAGTPTPAAPAPALGGRVRRSADFDERERQASAHQYKAMMVPLLLTLGAILLALGVWVLVRAGGAEAAVPEAQADVRPALARWFPPLALPLGAILLAGAGWFHLDVRRKRK